MKILKNHKLERKWINALRNPDNQNRQCFGMSNHEGRVCAVQLLIEIAEQNGQSFNCASDLFINPYKTAQIMDLNDCAKLSFLQIADRIEW